MFVNISVSTHTSAVYMYVVPKSKKLIGPVLKETSVCSNAFVSQMKHGGITGFLIKVQVVSWLHSYIQSTYLQSMHSQELLEEGYGYPQCRLLFSAQKNGQNRSLYK